MDLQNKIFVFGLDPGDASSFRKEMNHPKFKGHKVRFVKDAFSGTLYFNMKDFLGPYKKNPYEKIILSLVPRRFRKMNRIWMSTTAWDEIRVGIERGKHEEVITGWKERSLF